MKKGRRGDMLPRLCLFVLPFAGIKNGKKYSIDNPQKFLYTYINIKRRDTYGRKQILYL